MDLEIQTRHIELDPAWRDLIERSAERFRTRYPEVLRLHVTLKQDRHHRVDAHHVSLVANVEGGTLYADKREAHVPAALRAAFDSLRRKLRRHHRVRRRVS